MELDVLIVGAGVVGLACAAELAPRRRVVVLERHRSAGLETSSRNSEVIHAGLYYPEGTLKAELCVEGRERVYERCQRLRIPHRPIGKLVVATSPDEVQTLEQIERRGTANGAALGGFVDEKRLRELEPRIRARAALWSPRTGIVDAHALVSSYQAELESHGGTIAFLTEVVGLEARPHGWRVHTRPVLDARAAAEPAADPDEAFAVDAACVVNAAGLEADAVAALAGLDVDRLGLRQHLCKGDYFAAAPALGALTRHLVYPVPARAGLGIHVTVDLGGRYRFGPDVEYVGRLDYRVDPAKAKDFAEAVRRYCPEIEPEHLTPDFAGIRPKLQGPGEAFRDFVIAEASPHGAPGLVNLVGIESPGMTSAPAIARRVAAEIDALLGTA